MGEHQRKVAGHLKRKGYIDWVGFRNDLSHGAGARALIILLVCVLSIGLIPVLQALLFVGRSGAAIVQVGDETFAAGVACVALAIVVCLYGIYQIFRRNIVRPPNFRHSISNALDQGQHETLDGVARPTIAMRVIGMLVLGAAGCFFFVGSLYALFFSGESLFGLEERSITVDQTIIRAANNPTLFYFLCYVGLIFGAVLIVSAFASLGKLRKRGAAAQSGPVEIKPE